MHYIKTTLEHCAMASSCLWELSFSFWDFHWTQQAGEAAQLSDNGNIRLCLPLEKTATAEGEEKIPLHWMTMILFWGAQDEGSQPNSSSWGTFARKLSKLFQ